MLIFIGSYLQLDFIASGIESHILKDPCTIISTLHCLERIET